MTAATSATKTWLLDLRLPYPVSLNKAYRAVGGRVILSTPSRQYKLDVATAINIAYGAKGGLVIPPRTELKMLVRLHIPSKLLYKCDWDNAIKILQDAIFACNRGPQEGNDAYVMTAQVRKVRLDPQEAEVFPKGYCVVKLGLLQAEAGKKTNG